MGQKIKHRQKSGSSRHQAPRNWTAKEMITSGTGISRKFRDKRDRRPLEQEQSWQQEEYY